MVFFLLFVFLEQGLTNRSGKSITHRDLPDCLLNVGTLCSGTLIFILKHEVKHLRFLDFPWNCTDNSIFTLKFLKMVHSEWICKKRKCLKYKAVFSPSQLHYEQLYCRSKTVTHKNAKVLYALNKKHWCQLNYSTCLLIAQPFFLIR